MNTIKWQDSWSVHVERIDSQHKKLEEMINRLDLSRGKETDRLSLHGVLMDMKDYLIYHFETEENYMTEYRYPGLKEHRAEHKEFTAKTLEFIHDFKQGVDNLPCYVVSFLKSWLINHILGTDVKLGSFLQEKGVEDKEVGR